MPTIFLSSYSIRLINKTSGEILTTDSFLPGTDLFDVFIKYVTHLSTNIYQDSQAQKLLRVSKHQSIERTVSGIIDTGDWGYEGDLFDVQSQSITHHRTVNEAQMLPFYFLSGFPSKSDESVLLLQRFGQFGIRNIFGENFSEYFTTLHPDIEVAIYPLIPKDLLTQYLEKGRITKARFIRYGLPSDIADHLSRGNHYEEEGYLELIIHARRKGHLPFVDRIRDVITGQKDVKSMYEIRDFDYDNVKIEVDINGMLRTIDLSHLERLRTYYDVTNEIEIGTNGHPVYDSIDKYARTLLRDILSTMGNPDVQ